MENSSSIVTINQGHCYYYFKQLLNEEKNYRQESIGKYYQSKKNIYKVNEKIVDENIKGEEWQIIEHVIQGNKYYGFVHQNVITLEQLLNQLIQAKQKIKDQKNVKNQEKEKVAKNKQDKETLIKLLSSLIVNLIDEFINLKENHQLGHFNFYSENILVTLQKPCFYNSKTIIKPQVTFINFGQSEEHSQDQKQIMDILQKVYLIYPKINGLEFNDFKKFVSFNDLKQLKGKVSIKPFNPKLECLNKWNQQKLDGLNKIFNQNINEDVFLPISAFNGVFLQAQFLNTYNLQEDSYQQQVEKHQNLVKLIKDKQQEFLDYQETKIKEEKEAIGQHFKFEINFDELKIYQSLYSDALFETLVELQNFDINALFNIESKIKQVFENSKNWYLEILQKYSRLSVQLQILILINSFI